MCFTFAMLKDQTRRNFLRTAPLAAAITLPLTEQFLFASGGASGGGQAAAPEPFQVFTAEKLADAMKMLQAKPGNDSLFEPKAVPLTIVMTTEGKKSAKEFEYHEGRDHVLQILDGTTSLRSGRNAEECPQHQARRVACPHLRRSHRADAPQGRHAGDSAGHTAQTQHRGKRHVDPDLIDGLRAGLGYTATRARPRMGGPHSHESG